MGYTGVHSVFPGHDPATPSQLCPPRHAEYGTQRQNLPFPFHPDRPGADWGLGGAGLSHALVNHQKLNWVILPRGVQNVLP